MKKCLKRLLLVISTLVFLLGAGVFVLASWVKPESFKPQLIQFLQKTTGHPVTIDGALSWTLFPVLGMKAENIQLGNPDHFAPGSLLRIKEVDIGLALRPLWAGKICISKIILNDFTLHLIKNAQGQTNWQDLFSKNSTGKTVVVEKSASASSHKVSHFNPGPAVIAALDLQNGEIIVDDALQSRSLVLRQINLKSEKMGFNQIFPVSLSFLLQTTAFPKPMAIHLQSDVAFDKEAQTLDLTHLKGSLNDFILKGHLVVKQLGDQPRVTGNLEIPSFDANRWLAGIGKPLTSAALHKVSAQFVLDATAKNVQLKDIKAIVDDSHITGNFSSLNQKDPAFLFDFLVDKVDTSKFLSSGDRAATVSVEPLASPKKPNEGTTAKTLLPLDFLRSINASGQIGIAQLVTPTLAASNLQFAVKARAGVIQIPSLVAQIFGGHLQSAVTIDVRDVNPVWRMLLQFKQIDIRALIQHFKKMSPLDISGIGEVNAKMNTSGNTIEALTQFLNGEIAFALKEGVLHGIDIPYYSHVADALINKTPPTRPDTKQTAFGQMTGTLQVTHGVIQNNDLLLQAPQMTVSGKGVANLVTQQLNYQIQLQRLTSGEVAKPRGPAIPILIAGPFSHPKIRPDWQVLLVSQAKSQLNEQLEKHQQVIDEHIKKAVGNGPLGQKLQQGLQSLLGN